MRGFGDLHSPRRQRLRDCMGYFNMIGDEPEIGFYRIKRVKGGVCVGVCVWFGPPHDPDTGEVMDRSLRWQAKVNGEIVNIDSVWPHCAREPIGSAEYWRLLALSKSANPDDLTDPFSDPRRAINKLTAPLPAI